MKVKEIKKQVKDLPIIPIEQFETYTVTGEEIIKGVEKEVERLTKLEAPQAQIDQVWERSKGIQEHLKYKRKRIVARPIKHEAWIKKFYKKFPETYLSEYMNALRKHLKYMINKHPKLFDDDLLRGPIQSDDRFRSIFTNTEEQIPDTTDLCHPG